MNDFKKWSSSTQSIKTFEQREQEYAQARLRILGSAHPDSDQSINSIQATNSNINSSNLSNQTNRQNLSLTRDPNGPDGSRGFKNYSK